MERGRLVLIDLLTFLQERRRSVGQVEVGEGFDQRARNLNVTQVDRHRISPDPVRGVAGEVPAPGVLPQPLLYIVQSPPETQARHRELDPDGERGVIGLRAGAGAAVHPDCMKPPRDSRQDVPQTFA